MPEPTVTVRMKRDRVCMADLCVRSRERAMRWPVFACPGIFVHTIEENMNQTPNNPKLRIAVIHSAWHDDLPVVAYQ